MNEKDFIEVLDGHDWHYRRSDDSSVVSRGKNSESRIDLIIKNDPELEKVYKDYRFKNFGW